MRGEERLDISDSLGVVAEEDAVDALRGSGGDVWLVIVEEEHLRRSDAQPLAGYRIDARVRLGDAFLMRIDDEVNKLAEMKARLFLAARANEAVAEQRRLVARAQAAEVRGKLWVRLATDKYPRTPA